MVDIRGMSKIDVLRALWANSKAQGGSEPHQRVPSDEELKKAIGDPGSDLYFDYFFGRVIKVDLSGDEFDPWLYDRDLGPGAAARAVASLDRTGPES